MNGVEYSIATGRLFCPMEELHREIERLLDRPVFTHEMANARLWDEARRALEAELTEAFSVPSSDGQGDE